MFPIDSEVPLRNQDGMFFFGFFFCFVFFTSTMLWCSFSTLFDYCLRERISWRTPGICLSFALTFSLHHTCIVTTV